MCGSYVVSTHLSTPLFCSRLIYLADAMKRLLNQDNPDGDAPEEQASMDVVEHNLTAPELEKDKEIPTEEAHFVSWPDDYAHRGESLSGMCLYVYAMYVRRQPRKASNSFNYGFPFAAHYCLSQDYVQCIRSIPVVPVLRGFYLPTAVQNAEYNAMYKLVLFAPWQCTGEKPHSIPSLPGSGGCSRQIPVSTFMALDACADRFAG